MQLGQLMELTELTKLRRLAKLTRLRRLAKLPRLTKLMKLTKLIAMTKLKRLQRLTRLTRLTTDNQPPPALVAASISSRAKTDGAANMKQCRTIVTSTSVRRQGACTASRRAWRCAIRATTRDRVVASRTALPTVHRQTETVGGVVVAAAVLLRQRRWSKHFSRRKEFFVKLSK